ncbi:MAG: aminoacyl-tRNA hydrolase [Candidatus Cloacimonetes bacterium]|nr:aminoacyl-tRNA hydrolase [Candidatus Cloacimonadota bacterium]
MKLILGLGNIGEEYQFSRHNSGFMCLDAWAAKRGLKFRHGDLFDFLLHKDTCLIKPNTWMNRSGLALEEALRRWKPSQILAVYDDLEIPLGAIRIRSGGGDGGHNGIKSLLGVLPADQIKRIRIGIGRDDSDPREYVLEDFSSEELQKLQPVLKQTCEFMDVYIKSDFSTMLNAYSVWKKSCSGDIQAGNKSPKENDNGKTL